MIKSTHKQINYIKILIITFFVTLFLYIIIATVFKPYFLSISELYIHSKRDWIRSGKIGKDVDISNKQTIIFLSDSAGTGSILPIIFDQTLNNTTYSVNLSQPGHGTKRLYYILKEFVENNYVPDILFMHPSYKRHYKFALNGTFKENLEISRDQNSLNLEILAKHFVLNFNHKRINYLRSNLLKKPTPKQKIESMIKERGAFFPFPFGKYQKYNGQKGVHLNKPSHLDTLNIHYQKDVYRLLDYAKSLKIKVFFLPKPYRKQENLQYTEIPPVIKQLTKKYSNFIETKNFPSKYGYLNEHFADPGHLNYNGARLFSRDIATSFKKYFKD